jgi:hypothetical protein
MKQLPYELLRGLAYRNIRHSEMRAYTTYLPLALWAVLIALYLLLPAKPVLLGKDGSMPAALSVIATLPGFYIAALAAVATFGGPSMDQEMPSPAPQLAILVKGRETKVRLTRRQFLSYLFSYLVIVSFCFTMVMLVVVTPSLSLFNSWTSTFRYGDAFWFLAKLGAVMGMTALFSSMVISTLHGVFFLTEKIHQP